LLGTFPSASAAAAEAGSASQPSRSRLDLEAPGPFPSAPLEMDPVALAEAVAALPPPEGAPAQMIFQESRFEFDAAGRISFRRHWIYRILRAEGLRDWGVSQVRYSPWHQERPTVQVRVIDPDLRVRRYETSSYREKPAAEGRDDLFGDRRVLELALPVAVGSIVEELIEVDDREPYFAAGTTLRHYAALYIPVLRGRLVLEAPTRLPLRYGMRVLPGVEPVSTVANGRVRLDFDYQHMPAAGAVEVGVPAYRPRFPHIAFSTGRSWKDVAAYYQSQVEARLAAASVATILESWPIPSPDLPRRDRVAALLATLQARVRTNSLELGATSPLPRPIAEVVKGGRGDGKDIATLMLALLRRSGLDGHLVLLSSGFGPDCEPKLPGLGLFNHALVLLPARGQEPALWLDPSTPFVRAGELPLPAQARFALIVDKSTEELELTPASKPSDNRTEETREVFFADYGLGRVVERSLHWGSADRNQRQVTDGLEPAVRRRGYQAYVQAMHGAAALGEIRETTPSDFSTPFTLEVEALGSSRVKTDFDQATLEIPQNELLRRLPSVFQAESSPPRQEEFIFHEPFATRWHYVIHLPPGFAAGELPASSERALGPATLKTSFHAEGNLVLGELSLDVGQRLISAHQFDAMRAAVRELAQEPDPVLVFPQRARQWLAGGKSAQALAELRAAVAAEPQRVSHRARLARTLIELGFFFEAQRQARESTRLAPGWSAAHFVLGQALAYDELGRRFSPYADLEAAEASLRRAQELETQDPRLAAELAELQAARAKLAALAAPRPELHPDDPQSPLEKLLLAHLGGEGEAALALLHPRTRDLLGLAALDPLTHWLESSQIGGPPAEDPLADWQERLAPKASGAPHLGYRVSLDKGQGCPAQGCRIYVSKNQGTLAIVGTSEEPALLGFEALARLAEGDLEGAYRWLDWAREDITATRNDDKSDPFGLSAWLELWKGEKEPEKTRLERAKIAAAALAAELDRSGSLITRLDAEGGASPAMEAAKAASRSAAGRFAELEGIAAGLLTRYPDSKRARRWHFEALRGLGNWDALEKSAEERLSAAPQDQEALRAKADWAALVGAPERSLEPLRRLHQAGDFGSEDAVQFILAALASPEKVAKEEAQNFSEGLERTPELLAALAALEAEKGEREKAQRLLREAADQRPLKAPLNEDLYIVGRLAEGLGLEDLARDAYQRLPPPGQSGPFSYALLSRRRLAAK